MTQWRPSEAQQERLAYRRRQALSRSAIAVASTTVVLVAIVVFTVRSPGWERVRSAYFDFSYGWDLLPDLARAFVLNVKLFLVAEFFILIVALLVAVIRVVPAPAMAPLRL